MQTDNARRRGVTKIGRSGRAKRSGTSLVEMAIVASLLMLLALGVVEYAWMFHVWHSMTNAARDACRTLAVRNETEADAIAVALNELSPIHAPFAVTAVQPGPSSTNRDCIVTITVPRSAISIVGPNPLLPPPSSSTLQAQVTMRKEGD